MHLQLSDIVVADKLKGGIVCALIMTQVLLLCRLLALHTSATWPIAFLCGIPVALACGVLTIHKSHLRYIDMTMAMFAMGGLGMLAGFLVDINGLGVYGLLSLCRTTDYLPLSLDSLWLKMQLTPWMYAGMFVGGNVGMLLFDLMRLRRFSLSAIGLSDYIICNVGMLIGMQLGEALSMSITLGLNPLWVAVVMIGFMLLGMALGMIALLHFSVYLKGQSCESQ